MGELFFFGVGDKSKRSVRFLTVKLNIRVLAVVLFTIYGFFSPLAMAQSLCEPHSKLFCLVPNQLGVPSDQFKALNEAIGIVVSDLPLASPASGVIFTIDPKLNLPVPGNETLGPILTQRPETAGKHRLYFAAVYQFFRFEDLDGISLKHIPVVTITPNLGFDTNNRLDLTVNQVTGYAESLRRIELPAVIGGYLRRLGY